MLQNNLFGVFLMRFPCVAGNHAAPSRARTNVSGGRPAVALVDYLDQRGEILSDAVKVSVDLTGESSPPASVHEAASDSLADSDTVPPIVGDENRSKLFSLVGQDIGVAVGRWIKGGEDSPERVITEFELWMDRGVQRLREEREGGDPVEGDETVGNGEVGEDQISGKDGGPEDYDERDVLPIGLNSDGTLQVPPSPGPSVLVRRWTRVLMEGNLICVICRLGALP